MGRTTNKLLFWSPRILGILFALFLSQLALNVFSEDYGFWEAIVAFLIHLIPTLIVLLVIFIAWDRDEIGAVMFVALAMFYMVSSSGENWMIAVPMLLISALFLIRYLLKGKQSKEMR